jgi:hypothetical protein
MHFADASSGINDARRLVDSSFGLRSNRSVDLTWEFRPQVRTHDF